ncbi:MAG: thiamine-phosphate pyrophosphorylase [Sulfurovum sp. AS07-7]|nr:MAG: thiamine-phosphate pyrophosphorylase [Sulfurovum sp. AS07-7]
MYNKLKGIYAITDNILTPNDTILTQVEQALEGGAKIIQLRDKQNSDEQIEKFSIMLQELCNKYNALFVLNDRVDIAIKLNLDGLHIGKDDYEDLGKIREKFKGIIGVSCYGNLDSAAKAQKLGADYVAFGACFSSPTKPNAPTINLNIIKQAKEILDIPVCVIGGINRSNIDTIMTYKPDMVAIISDIWNADDIKERAKFFSNLLK